MFQAKIIYELVQNMICFGENSNHAQVIPHAHHCSGVHSLKFLSLFLKAIRCQVAEVIYFL